MLLLFSFRVAEWPPVWERAVHSVYCAYLSWTFIKFFVSFFPFWYWEWDVGCDCINSWSYNNPQYTVELQWLEHLWDYENLFETGVVRTIEGLLLSQVRRHNMVIFSIFFNMKVYCVFSLESPQRGDSNDYTQYTISQYKMKIIINYAKSATMGFVPRDPRTSSKKPW